MLGSRDTAQLMAPDNSATKRPEVRTVLVSKGHTQLALGSGYLPIRRVLSVNHIRLGGKPINKLQRGTISYFSKVSARLFQNPSRSFAHSGP